MLPCHGGATYFTVCHSGPRFHEISIEAAGWCTALHNLFGSASVPNRGPGDPDLFSPSCYCPGAEDDLRDGAVDGPLDLPWTPCENQNPLTSQLVRLAPLNADEATGGPPSPEWILSDVVA